MAKKDRSKELDEGFGITEDVKRNMMSVPYTIDCDKKRSLKDKPKMTD